ncbi:Kinase-like protein [Mycena indigotica]|uniref:Kinase-like protein n=1 Tax=Mycena indigotica TaxID=2126181 RepID=A0A8H6W978_9AGAR|nr:Kinase-like protein [Mycena indigotica]KAF7309437.1 Kinase-like protein [Mycena indigotica]
MSHSHTHAPGETHSHSHGPPQQPPQPTVDPKLQALIDADFQPVALNLQDSVLALCGSHSLEKCTECGVDYVNLNRMSRLLAQNPTVPFPPPPQMVTKNLSTMVTSTKDEGNAFFKTGKYVDAIRKYTTASSYAVQRPPWEQNGLMREELSIVISNRSVAFLEAKDYISALADAELVIQLRRSWGKGHLRKAKALQAMGQLKDAAEALKLGLAFDPSNAELLSFLAELTTAQES